MGIESFLIKGIQEVFYFDIFEAFFMLSFVLISTKKRISIRKGIFHIFMMAILDFLIPVLVPIPLAMQILAILSYSAYLSLVLRTEIKIILNNIIKSYFMFFVLEIFLAIIYKTVFKVELISMEDYNLKFLYMLGFRIVEFLVIYIYFRYKEVKIYNEDIKKYN